MRYVSWSSPWSQHALEPKPAYLLQFSVCHRRLAISSSAISRRSFSWAHAPCYRHDKSNRQLVGCWVVQYRWIEIFKMTGAPEKFPWYQAMHVAIQLRTIHMRLLIWSVTVHWTGQYSKRQPRLIMMEYVSCGCRVLDHRDFPRLLAWWAQQEQCSGGTLMAIVNRLVRNCVWERRSLQVASSKLAS